MYPTSNHVQPAHNPHHNLAYNTHQPPSNGHHNHNGHAHHQSSPSTHRPSPAQPPAQKEPISVYAIPSVTIQGDDVVVGDSHSRSLRCYTPLKMVGDGSFGTVWLCDWHEKLPPKTPLSAMQCNAGSRPEYAGKRLVAVKRMKKRWEGGWDECKKLKELESLRAISYHPNIIPLYDFFLLPDSKELYFVFESMEGNLYQLIKSRRGRPLAGGLVSSVFRQVVSGLHHIHDSGYFHRDMKPENLLVTTTGLHDYRNLSPLAPPGAPSEKDVVVIVKLADFGLARETKSRPPYTEYVSTRWYRAPEVLLRSRDYSNPVDMWALGTIMAELVDLRPLFPGQDEIDQVTKICVMLGDPSDEYGTDSRGKPMGGGKWSKGNKMAKSVGFTFPKVQPRNLFHHFDRNVPPKLVECIVDLLRYDPEARLTSRQCLEHAYLQETTPLIDLPPFPPRYSASEPSVLIKSAPAARANGLPVAASESLPALSGRDVPPSHTQTSVSHPNLAKPPFNANGSGTIHLPDASASHRSAFYSSNSSATSGPSRAPTDYRPSHPNGSNASWPDSEPMEVTIQQRYVPPGPHHPMGSPMAQDVDPLRAQPLQVHANGDPQAQPSTTKPGKFSFGRKWGIFGGEKGQGQLPTVEEGLAGPPAHPTLKRAKSSSLDGHANPELVPSPHDLKKNKKEAARIAKEAEMARRAMAEKNQREQARAVMQKRRQMANAGGTVDTHAVPSHFVHANGTSATDDRKEDAAAGHAAASDRVSPGYLKPSDSDMGLVDEHRWRNDHHRMAKARRRDWDDDHSMSSSDVPSVGRMSVISFATVDSDPGPPNLRRRPSMFGLGRMTSSSSLRTSFGDDFPQSVRSSNSLSLEQQLASEFRTRATMDATGSPPPMNMLSLSPTQHAWSEPKRDGSRSPGLHHRPSYISLPPQRFPRNPSQLPSGPHSPYEFAGDLAGLPPSPGDPYSAINPIFKVPPLPVTTDLSGRNALPPFSQIEAVAEGEYPNLSPMSFNEPDD